MRDEWFIRGEVPMTKAEVRAVSLSKLELKADSVLWDIGAGTGSVSIEAALCHPVRKITAFERKKEAVRLILLNREKGNMPEEKLTLIEGKAPETFDLAYSEGSSGENRPTHAFIGGSSGSMETIIGRLLAINESMRIVVNIIALESLSALLPALKNRGIEAEILSLQVSKAKNAGGYHLMQGQNPVYIISFGGKDGGGKEGEESGSENG